MGREDHGMVWLFGILVWLFGVLVWLFGILVWYGVIMCSMVCCIGMVWSVALLEASGNGQRGPDGP